MIGLSRRRNKQRVDAGGGERDGAQKPGRPGADNRDFAGETRFHGAGLITATSPVKLDFMALDFMAIVPGCASVVGPKGERPHTHLGCDLQLTM